LIEIRFHGRGGQGAVTGVRILASAVHLGGKYAQAIPQYGTERRGAPVVAFCRIDDEYIKARDLVHEPDIIVVLDPTLSRSVDVASGLKMGGLAIVNSAGSYRDAGLSGNFKVATVDATSIALETLGRPITNTAILGAFAKATGLVDMENLEEAVREEFPPRIVESNVLAMRKAYEGVTDAVDVSSLPRRMAAAKKSQEPLISYSRDVSDWRIYRPVVDKGACIKCQRCWIYCPETAISVDEDGAEVDYTYCKGCGICAEECPVGAIKMELEEE
jgi:2-oxoacid:acceptor oxidoreductase gamma subunit (pyruvate/2-ketoisovalerate family)/2-oxoacid:acceptor oxidoreductase delta subunit (pyruvate/2-ketoisovalerate family)